MNFGFLINNYDFSFDGIRISPLPDYDELLQDVYRTWEVAGGWIYPPIHEVPAKQTHLEKHYFEQSGPLLPGKYFILPSRHSITFENGQTDDEHLRFLIMGYGFLLGRYLLPENYQHFCKTPHSSGLLHPLKAQLDDCEIGMKCINDFYSKSTSKERKQMFAILHWFLLSGAYEMPWDHFDAQYKVLDGIYRISVSKGAIIDNGSHAERPVKMAGFYGVELPQWAIIRPGNKKISDLRQTRNDLTHEALFAGEPIGYNPPTQNFRHEFPNFNTKLICKVLGLKTKYTQVSPGDRQLHLWGLAP